MLEMMSYALTNIGKLCNVITYNVVWANQKTESFVYCWLYALTMIDVTCFPAFLGASDLISSILRYDDYWVQDLRTWSNSPSLANIFSMMRKVSMPVITHRPRRVCPSWSSGNISRQHVGDRYGLGFTGDYQEIKMLGVFVIV